MDILTAKVELNGDKVRKEMVDGLDVLRSGSGYSIKQKMFEMKLTGERKRGVDLWK